MEENLPVPPELLDLGIRNENTTEGDQCSDEKRVDERCEDRIGSRGSNELTNASVDELVHQHDEEDSSSLVRSAGEANGVVERQEVEDGADDQVRNLRNDEASREWEPVVHFALLFARLVDVATLEEERLKLSDDTGCDEDEVEDGEENFLLFGHAVADHPESKTVEEGGTNVKSDLVVDVVNIAVQRHVHSPCDETHLLHHRGGELVTIVDSTRGLGSSIGDKVVKYLLLVAGFGGVKPNLVPVLALGQAAVDDINHVFRRVCLFGTGAAISSEVVLDSLSIITNVTKVDGASTLGQK